MLRVGGSGWVILEWRDEVRLGMMRLWSALSLVDGRSLAVRGRRLNEGAMAGECVVSGGGGGTGAGYGGPGYYNNSEQRDNIGSAGHASPGGLRSESESGARVQSTQPVGLRAQGQLAAGSRGGWQQGGNMAFGGSSGAARGLDCWEQKAARTSQGAPAHVSVREMREAYPCHAQGPSPRTALRAVRGGSGCDGNNGGAVLCHLY